MKLGLDIHGVLNENTQPLLELAIALTTMGNEVHIISGPPMSVITQELLDLGFVKGVHYTHIFSITDHHVSIGSDVTFDDKGHPFLDDYLWDRTKGDYCLKNGIDLHLDDSDTYSHFFKTPYARYYSKNKRQHYVKV